MSDPKPAHVVHLATLDQILTAVAGAVTMNMVVTVEPPCEIWQDTRVTCWADGTYPLENLHYND